MFMLIRPLAQERRAKVKVFRLGLCCNQRFFFHADPLGGFAGSLPDTTNHHYRRPVFNVHRDEAQLLKNFNIHIFEAVESSTETPDDSCLVDAAPSAPEWTNQDLPLSTVLKGLLLHGILQRKPLSHGSDWAIGFSNHQRCVILWSHVLFPKTHLLGYMTRAISSHHEQNLKPIAWSPSRCKIWQQQAKYLPLLEDKFSWFHPGSNHVVSSVISYLELHHDISWNHWRSFNPPTLSTPWYHGSPGPVASRCRATP